MDQGLLQETDPIDTSINLVKTAMQRWLTGQLGDLKCLDKFDLTLGATSEDIWEYRAGESEGFVFLAVPHECETSFTIGRGIEYLESQVTGLGQTTLAALEFACGRTFGAWTPCTGFETGSYIYWQGETTMEAWLEYMEENYGPESDGGWSSEDYFSPVECQSCHPHPWVVNPKRIISPRRLRKLAVRHPDKMVRDVSNLLQVICYNWSQLNNGDNSPMLPSCELMEAEPVYRSVTLRWSEEDCIPRVIDDWINFANENGDGYTDAYGMWDVPLSSDGFRKWKQSAEEGLHLYKQLDRLISLIAVSDSTGENDNA